jgi:hypothetical protein
MLQLFVAFKSIGFTADHLTESKEVLPRSGSRYVG